MAKILLIGASGTIGSAVADLLVKSHDVVRAAHSHGEYTVDLGDKASIETLMASVGAVDHVICAAGRSSFGPFDEAGDEDYALGIRHKLMGQVNLARIARGRIAPQGSITLTTGVLATSPMPGTAPTALVNAGLEGFVRAAALDMGDGMRINAVSPIFVTSTAERMGMSASGTMSAAETAKAYQAAIEGDMSGQILDVRDYGAVA